MSLLSLEKQQQFVYKEGQEGRKKIEMRYNFNQHLWRPL